MVLWLAYRIYAATFERFLGIGPVKPAAARAGHWLAVFGDHFSSIAGAGPIIGPVIAVSLWGWAPVTIFVILGTIFIGGIHDMGSLMVSAKNDGKSVADISEETISKRARTIFSCFVLLALIVTIAVSVYFFKQTFIVEPKAALLSLGFIPVAILAGMLTGSYKTLSGYLMFLGIAAGVIGIITSRPDFTTPAYIGWESSEGLLWPMLFVTVAGGAISGSHSLGSSKAVSKELPGESNIKKIGYGAMIAEAIAALLAIAVVAGGFQSFSHLQVSVAKGGPVNAFGEGFGYITRHIFGKHGSFIAIVALNIFILAALDAAVRTARYVLQGLFGPINKYFAALVIVAAGGCLALMCDWKDVWPLFGAANQLLAALTLVVISIWLLNRKKHTKFTLVPAIFMLVTTIGALGWQFGRFYRDKNWVLVGIDLVLVALALSMMVEIRKWISKKMRRA